jgi:RNA polymerase sigma-70 factor, ECF subfamily
VSVARARADREASSAALEPAAELDELTLRRAQRGDEAGCRALVERYQRTVFALLHRMLGPGRADRVEDVAQETFLHVFRSLAGFAPLGPARLSTWILTIASRRAVDELRRSGREDIASSPPGALEEGDAVSPSRADEGARHAALAARVSAAVAALAPEYRAAFLLRVYHGLEYAEIARALECEMGTVKSRLNRARAELRRALRADDDVEGGTEADGDDDTEGPSEDERR